MGATSLSIATLIALGGLSLSASEADALAISSTIQQRHMPFGGILDPIFSAPDSDQIIGYTRCGDSSIWTGHYLAAESFRYKVTRSPDALANVLNAERGLRALVDVTGTDLLARCLVPADSPFALGIAQEEQQHGVYTGSLNQQAYFWIGDTSRDQYSGVMFGLGVAYDMVDDPLVHTEVAALTTRLVDFLRHNNWAIVMPDGSISTIFLGRADQQLAFLQLARHMNSSRFSTAYTATAILGAVETLAPISIEVLDPDGSYFKFNLDTINLYSLIRLEGNSFFKPFYTKAYDILRRTTDDHHNAHFNMIDRALKGPNEARDASTRFYLELWLQRPRRDFHVDLNGVYPACGTNRACDPIPIEKRVTTDFLWQRSPFQLEGGGDGFIESAGIDYILPYWMARYYGVI
jgi:hypothetical protein